MICPWILPAKYIFFTPETSVLVYYSHITSLIVSLVILFLIGFSKNKSSSKNFLSLLIISFSVWVIFNLFLWTNNNSQLIIFLWSFFGLLTGLVSIFSYWLYRSFVLEKKNNWKYILFPIIALIPIIFITPTKFNLKSFDIDICGIAGNVNEGSFPYLYYSIAFLFFFLVVGNFIFNLKKILLEKKRQSLIFGLGIIFFMLSFFTASFFASYLAEHGFIQDFSLEQYGLFGMTAFMAVIAFIIVRFKAFSIKLIATQALVWALVILIGSQFFFIQNNTNRILTAITLVITSTIGVLLIRSVKKEVALREDLEISNNNQQSLIHLISHQLKGFFTKSKIIFAGIIEDDFGQSSDTLKQVAKEGLLSDNSAVTLIQGILSASNYKKGTIAYNMENIDLAELVKKVSVSFEKEIAEKGLELKKDISESPVIISADHIQISQVIKNLIDNSIKYTPAGSIKVSLKARSVNNKKKAVFEVEDTGVGLSESDKSRLFTEGGKGEESLKLNVNSTGYGLYIVKKIVENHHGKIWAESEGRGKGSIFYAVFELVG